MTANLYKGIMVKEEVAKRVRAKAKREGKTISAFLSEVLDLYDTKGRICDISDTSMKKLEGDLEEMMRGVLGEAMRR